MTAGLAVKAVAVGLETYHLGRGLQDLWASENRNRVLDLSDTWGGQQPRLNYFAEHLTAFCKDIAQRMGCRNTQIALDARFPTSGDPEWVAYPRGIDFFIGKPLVVVNREMLPNSKVISQSDPSFRPTEDALKQHHICQFYIARSLAHLKLNTALKGTVVRIIVFVGTVFFLSPVLPVASYAIALVVERFISNKVSTYYSKWATQIAIQYSSPEAQNAALARMDSMKREATSKAADCKRKSDAAKRGTNFSEAVRCAHALTFAEREKKEWEAAHADLDSLIRAARSNPQA